MQRDSDASAESVAEGQALSSWHAVQVLNNFTNFYITHQIFFLTFTILFILHPIPGLSHVHGLRAYLPVTYSWVRPPAFHTCRHMHPLWWLSGTTCCMLALWFRSAGTGHLAYMSACCREDKLVLQIGHGAPVALCIMHGEWVNRLPRAWLQVLRWCELW